MKGLLAQDRRPNCEGVRQLAARGGLRPTEQPTTSEQATPYVQMPIAAPESVPEALPTVGRAPEPTPARHGRSYASKTATGVDATTKRRTSPVSVW